MSYCEERIDLQLFATEGNESGGGQGGTEGGTEGESEKKIEGEEEGKTGGEEGSAEQGSFPSIPEELKPTVSKIVQDRVNKINKKYEGHDKYKKLTEKLSSLTGQDADMILTQLEHAEKGRGPGPHQPYRGNQPQGSHPQPPAGQGYDPRMMDMETKIKQTQEQTRNNQKQLEIQNLKSDPLYEDFEEYQSDVEEYADKKDISLKEAYWAVMGPEKAQKIQQQTEQRVMANINNRSGKKVEGDTGSEGAQDLGLTTEEFEAAKALGMSPEDYAGYKKIDNLGSYQKNKGG